MKQTLAQKQQNAQNALSGLKAKLFWKNGKQTLELKPNKGSKLASKFFEFVGLSEDGSGFLARTEYERTVTITPTVQGVNYLYFTLHYMDTRASYWLNVEGTPATEEED